MIMKCNSGIGAGDAIRLLRVRGQMTDQIEPVRLQPHITPDGHLLTPAGLQSRKTLFRRRVLMLGICAATLVLVLWGVINVFSADGLDALEFAIIASIALSAPWTILGFWNSLLGLALVRSRQSITSEIAPFATAMTDDTPLRSRVAVAMAVRNEDPARAFDRLIAIRRSLDGTGYGSHFDLHIISDTNLPDVAQAEEALFAANRTALNGKGVAGYRRRTSN